MCSHSGLQHVKNTINYRLDLVRNEEQVCIYVHESDSEDMGNQSIVKIRTIFEGFVLTSPVR
jgi:hypothetical protein